jgi:hypothetical protein
MVFRMMDDRALNRALLARQLLLQRATLTPFAATEHLIGLQSQAPHPPYTGLWTRLADFDPELVSAGLLNRSLVRASTFRGTVHLMSARDAQGVRPLLQPTYDRLLRANAAFPKLQGLDFDAIATFGRRELGDRPRSMHELHSAILAHWPDRDPAAIALAISDLVPLVQIPPRGLWRTAGKPLFTPLDTWIGELADPPPLETFVRRYLTAYGPATPQDMHTWSGLMGLKEAFERVRPELLAIPHGKRILFDLPEAPRPDPETPAPVRFIPEWDNLLIGHKVRTRIIPEAYRKRIATPNGMVPGTVLIDGFMNGTWKVKEEKDGAALAITLFSPIATAECTDLEQEADRLLAFLCPDANTRSWTITIDP